MAISWHTTRRFAFAALIVLIAIGQSAPVVFADEINNVRLLVGRSIVVNTESRIARVSLTNADVADALVTEPNQLLIQGKVPGTISMFVWDRAGAMRRYEVIVERDLSRLALQIRELFPSESITVQSNGKAVVIAGAVTSKFVADKAVEVAGGYVEKKEDIVSLLQVRDAGPPPQVLLRVRFAEVSRNALTELGIALFTGPAGYKNYVGRSTTQQFSAPIFDNRGRGDQLVFSDFLNLFLFDLKNQLGTAIRALQSRGLFQSLAEPNLVAESGKEASFLAGGEFPIPVAQGGVGSLAIAIVFKEFGVRLNFTPTVAGTDRVHLKVRPEVSTLDFTNAITLQGFRIPALSTRRAETEIELQNGQTFAIAGLLNNTTTQALQKVPGIGDIPILGYLFRSKAAQKSRTELVVMITPEILPRNSPGVTQDLPRLREPYLPPLAPNQSFPPPGPPFMPPRPGNDAASAAPNAADSARLLADRLPKSPTLISPAPTPEPPKEPPPALTAMTRPMTSDEKKAMQKALEDERKAQERQAREMEKLEKREQQLAREQAKRDAKAAAEQAKREAEAEKKAAKNNKSR